MYEVVLTLRYVALGITMKAAEAMIILAINSMI